MSGGHFELFQFLENALKLKWWFTNPVLDQNVQPNMDYLVTQMSDWSMFWLKKKSYWCGANIISRHCLSVGHNPHQFDTLSTTQLLILLPLWERDFGPALCSRISFLLPIALLLGLCLFLFLQLVFKVLQVTVSTLVLRIWEQKSWEIGIIW